ncbi:MAG: DUF1015 domain-containing protein [Alkalispirochaeta sp.]
MSNSPTGELPFIFSDVILPQPAVDLKKWAVIACDQFTSDPEYWQSVTDFVGNAPSTLHMIVPEIYLSQGDTSHRLERINATMEQYRRDDTLRTVPESAVYVRRTLPSGTVRQGLVVAVDLEAYDYSPESTSEIRASEETIPARLPARVDIRREASLESPHVLVLFDDPDDTVMDHLGAANSSLEELYATELMEGGGEIAGYRVPADSSTAQQLVQDLKQLPTPAEYGFRFATGDGNHSLAAAKALWEEVKASGAVSDDPRRWCLVELVNVYDPGLPFHPIHRLVTGTETAMLDALLRHSDARFHGFPVDRIAGHIAYEGLSPREIAFIGPNQAGILTLPEEGDLPVAVADAAIAHAGTEEVDYVHGFEEVVTAAERSDAIAVILPHLDRSRLFATVSRDGALPRKAFSLGEARDKRYYLECRALR